MKTPTKPTPRTSLGLIFTAAFTFASPLAYAGVGSTGGGDVIECGRDFLGLTSKKTYLADTYMLDRQNYLDGLKAMGSVHEEQIIEAAVKLLEKSYPGMGKLVAKAISKKLTFIPVQKLEELDDDNIALEVKGCVKRQLGIQDLQTGEVRYHSGRLARLNLVERALFKVHEAFIQLRNAPGDTTAIRGRVRSILESQNFAAIMKPILKRDLRREATLDRKTAIIQNLMFGVCSTLACHIGYAETQSGFQSWLEQQPRRQIQYGSLVSHEVEWAWTLSRVLASLGIEISANAILHSYYANSNQSFDALSESIASKALFPLLPAGRI